MTDKLNPVDDVMRRARECSNKNATPANWHGLRVAVESMADASLSLVLARSALRESQLLVEALQGEVEGLRALLKRVEFAMSFARPHGVEGNHRAYPEILAKVRAEINAPEGAALSHSVIGGAV